MSRHRLNTGLIMLVIGLITACTSGSSDRPVPSTTPSTTPSTRTESAAQVEPQSQKLMLRLTSPSVNMITEYDQINVAGVTSPDATLSVNGRLVSPNSEGLFSIDMDFSNPSIPMVIEVIASSITGETKSEIRPVIFSGGSVQSGIFGTVHSVTPSSITLDTNSGVVSLSVDGTTSLALHGRESPSISDITAGSLVGVIRHGLQAKSILAVPIRPVLTRHFTGVVTALEAAGSSSHGRITLLDSSTRQITVNTTAEISKYDIGSVVTAVLEQDLSNGDLHATAIDPALDSAERILGSLRMNQETGSREGKENITSLRWRLAEHGVRNISMLLDRQPNESWKDSLTSAENAYTRFFSEHHIGSPTADVTGLVTSIATSLGPTSTKLITVQPASGQPVMVKITENTPISLFGDRIKSGQLDLASQITVRYTIKGNVANQVTVMAGNTLSPESSAQLAAIAGHGEVQGLLTDVIDPKLMVSILVDRETGQQMSLRSEGARIFHNGIPTDLDSSLEGSNVFAWYDTTTYRLLELESLDLSAGEDLISGVIDGFIPKFASGNLTIRTGNGQMRRLTHHANTDIRRDGLRVSIHEVRPGDLVRPNTKIRMSDGIEEVVSLSLKTPEAGRTSGSILGVIADREGQVQVTISNIWLDLISLKVTSSTRISQHGHAVSMQDLKVGQEVNLATYNPLTLETASIALNAHIKLGRATR